jgi:hypothetical protein
MAHQDYVTIRQSRTQCPEVGSSLQNVPTQPPIIDVASAAGSYATYGGLLVGFAFSGLLFYLTDKQPDAPDDKRGDPPLVKKGHVTLTVLFAMASLSMTSFLYANLAGEAVPERKHSP